MTLPIMATTKAGTVLIVAPCPSPWPPAVPAHVRHELADGCILIEAGLGSAITAAVIQRNGDQETLCHQVLSCPLVIDPGTVLAIFVRWGQGRSGISINGQEATIPAAVPCLLLSPMQGSAVGAVDFSKKNRNAVTGRKNRYSDLPPEAGRKAGGIEYLFRSLGDEAVQLRDLLDLVRSGKTAHVRGLASRLRVLLHRQGQVPALLAAAAAKNMPLTVYTFANPNLRMPIMPNFSLLIGVSAVPRRLFSNPVDLGVWLDLPAMDIGENTLSNADVIADLGSTIGAHLDLNIKPSIVALTSFESGTAGKLEDALTRYLTSVASCVLVLCERVLDEPCSFG